MDCNCKRRCKAAANAAAVAYAAAPPPPPPATATDVIHIDTLLLRICYVVIVGFTVVLINSIAKNMDWSLSHEYIHRVILCYYLHVFLIEIIIFYYSVRVREVVNELNIIVLLLFHIISFPVSAIIVVLISGEFYSGWKSWVLNRYKFFLEMETNADGSIQNEDQFEGECCCIPRCRWCCFLYKPVNSPSTCCNRFQWCNKRGSWRDTRHESLDDEKKERRAAFSRVIFKWNNLPLFVVANIFLTIVPILFAWPSTWKQTWIAMRIMGSIIIGYFTYRVHDDLIKKNYLPKMLMDIRYDNQRWISHQLCFIVVASLGAWLYCLVFLKHDQGNQPTTNSTSNSTNNYQDLDQSLNQEEDDTVDLQELNLELISYILYECGGGAWSFTCIVYILRYWGGKRPVDDDESSSSSRSNDDGNSSKSSESSLISTSSTSTSLGGGKNYGSEL